ncbi:MAG: MFS transporter [Rhizobiales bacterium]|nr:MFS transporter [Hyphomicrobiales bacterium]
MTDSRQSQAQSQAQSGLGMGRLAAYATPGLPLATLTLTLTIFVPNFYASDIGLSLAGVGAALFLLRIFDAVIDPVIGYLSDKSKSRFGRRRSWFAFSVPVATLSGYMVLVPPEGASLSYLIVWMGLLSLSLSATSLSYTAWGAELETGYDERNRVAAFREIAILTGTLVASAVPFILQSIGPTDTGRNLTVIALFVAVLLPAFSLFAIMTVPEPVNRSHASLSLRESLRALSRNRPFLRLIVAFLFNSVANGFPVTLFLFFVADVLGAKEWQGALLLIYFVCGMAGVPLWVTVARRFGKHRTWCVAMLIACAIFAAAPLLGRGDLAAFMVITVLTGFILGADLVIPTSIQADVIDYDTADSGDQRSGLYFAAWSLATQLSLAATVGVAFLALDSAGFDADRSGSLPADAPGLTLLAVLYGWVPVAMKLIAVALMWSFPIDRMVHDELTRRIAEARTATA